ncbi:hypothetical protein DB347_17985 [Opitutaceae bacterium EW11]|nr:hypothetical protein DB347_17985 [Opitutaceae bacterium EW11]
MNDKWESPGPVSELFGVALQESEVWLDRDPGAVARIACHAKVLGSDVAFRRWLRVGNPLLEKTSPLEWIRLGRAREVAEFVEDADAGQPT